MTAGIQIVLLVTRRWRTTRTGTIISDKPAAARHVTPMAVGKRIPDSDDTQPIHAGAVKITAANER